MLKQQILSGLITFLAFFVLLFAYTKLAGPIPFTIDSVTTTKGAGFSVTGEGKAEIKPDQATVNLGVQVQGSTTSEVQDKMNKAINAVTSAVKQQGIDPKDIQTAQYTINPTYDYSSGSQKITGYSGSTNVVVKVRDINKVNAVIDAATANGANQIGSPQFGNADKSTAEDQARALAIADAKKKAQAAASAAGFSLGKIINYSETEGGQPRPVPLVMGGGAANSEATPPTQVEPGQNEIDMQVTLTYEVK